MRIYGDAIHQRRVPGGSCDPPADREAYEETSGAGKGRENRLFHEETSGADKGRENRDLPAITLA